MTTTSLRLGVGESNSLTIQAKAKAKEDITLLPPNTLLQVHGEIDTATFSPSFLSIDARIGVGVQLKKDHEHSYYVRWKKVFPLIIDCTSLMIKGSCYANKDFSESKASGVVKLAWDVPNNQNKKDRMNQKKKDRMMKIGFDILKKVPYLQVKENNWTLNADMAGIFIATNTRAIMQTTPKIEKTPASPIESSRTGRLYVTIMFANQYEREHMAMQIPRTRVGKISEHMMLGTGPNPMTKQQK